MTGDPYIYGIAGLNNTSGTATWTYPQITGATTTGSYFSGFSEKPNISIKNVSELLKDGITREIILCKDREECKQKYGEYGLKFFDSMLNEVLQEAIKSEELFNKKLQEINDKYEKLYEIVKTNIPETIEDITKQVLLETLNTFK